MNPFALLSLASLAISALLIGYILSKNPRGAAARIYVLLLVAFLLWSIPEFLLRAYPGEDPATRRLLVRLAWTGISFIPALMAHFVLAYPRRSSFLEVPWSFLVLYTPSVVFTTFLWGGDLLVRDVVVGPFGFYSAQVGSLYLPLASLYALIILLALAYLYRGYARAEDRRARLMLGFVLAGFAIPTLAGTVTEVYGPLLTATGTRLGFGTLWTTLFLAFVAYALFRYGFLTIEASPEVQPVARRLGWASGRNHLVLEEGRQGSYTAFREMVQEAPGLCVTPFPPQLLAPTYDLHRTPFLWLSGQRGYPRTLKPTYLEVDVLHTILKFLATNPGSAVLLDDLEYLAEVNGDRALFRTVARVAAEASKNRCTLISSLTPGTLGPEAMERLRGLFDEVQMPDGAGEGGQATLTSAGAVLWEGEREACFQQVARAPHPRKALATTVFPDRLRREAGLEAATFVWISPTRHGEVASYDASRLHYEVYRDLTRAVEEGTLLYVGELEVLVEQTDFLTVLEYVKRLVDLAVARNALAVASLREGALPREQASALRRRFAGSA